MPDEGRERRSPRRDPALDGLRGIAVLLVFLFHYGGGLRSSFWLLRVFGRICQSGWIGVDVFFALSGYLITGILLQSFGPVDSPSSQSTWLLGHFFARRALRILPLYVLAIAICACTALACGVSIAQLRPLLVYLAFLQNTPPFVLAAQHAPPPVPLHHLWSLAVEEQFYLLWPLLLWLPALRQRGVALGLAAFAGSCVFRLLIFRPAWFAEQEATLWMTVLPARLGALALGCALAAFQSRRSDLRTPGGPYQPVPWSATPFWAAAGMGLLVLLLAGWQTHSLLLKGRLAYLEALPGVDLLSAAAVALTLTSTMLRRGVCGFGLPSLGRLSYGFYVFHLMLQPVVDHLVFLVPPHATSGFRYQALRLLFAFPLSLAAAWASFHIWEKPFLRWKTHFSMLPQSSSDTVRITA